MSASDELGKKFAENHPADAARVIEHATPDGAAAFLQGIRIAAAADVLRHMNVRLAAAVLSAVELAHAADIVARLPANHAARVLRQVNPVTAGTLLERVPEKTARSLRSLLRYREGTAGWLADPHVLTFPHDINVGDAQRQLRRLADAAYYNVYVTDRDHRLVGVVTIRALLLARPKQRLESIMQRHPISVRANSDLGSIAVNPAWQEFDMLPVVDKADAFLGVIRHKTIRQLAETGDHGPNIVDLVDVAFGIADVYWRSLSSLAAGVAVAAASQRNDEAHSSRR